MEYYGQIKVAWEQIKLITNITRTGYVNAPLIPNERSSIVSWIGPLNMQCVCGLGGGVLVILYLWCSQKFNVKCLQSGLHIICCKSCIKCYKCPSSDTYFVLWWARNKLHLYWSKKKSMTLFVVLNRSVETDIFCLQLQKQER
jgi:hypothetical protein